MPGFLWGLLSPFWRAEKGVWSWGNPRKESRAKSWMPLIKCIELAARHSAENGAFTSFLACKTFSEIVEQTWSNGGVSYATDKDINTFHRLEQCDKILCRKFAIVFIWNIMEFPYYALSMNQLSNLIGIKQITNFD